MTERLQAKEYRISKNLHKTKTLKLSPQIKKAYFSTKALARTSTTVTVIEGGGNCIT
jgi:hypothetical protein